MKQRKKHIWKGLVLAVLAAGIAVPTAQGRYVANNGVSGPSTSVRGSGEIRAESTAKARSAVALQMQRSGEIRSESRARLQSALALGSQRSPEIRSESVAKLQTAHVLGLQSGAPTVTGDGVDWSNVGIGVGVALASAMLLGAFVISRRRQVHLGV
jgi:hypothetical protein